MIFWLIAIIFSVLVVLAILDDCFMWTDGFSLPGLSVFVGLIFVVALVIVISANVGINGYVEANKQRYESLVYQAENNLYDNDNDIGKKELVNQIQEWNEDLATGKSLQHDFWLGIFYPDVYDYFDFIPMDILKGGG